MKKSTRNGNQRMKPKAIPYDAVAEATTDRVEVTVINRTRLVVRGPGVATAGEVVSIATPWGIYDITTDHSAFIRRP